MRSVSYIRCLTFISIPWLIPWFIIIKNKSNPSGLSSVGTVVHEMSHSVEVDAYERLHELHMKSESSRALMIVESQHYNTQPT